MVAAPRRCVRVLVAQAREQRPAHALVGLHRQFQVLERGVPWNTVGFWNLRPMPSCAISDSAQFEQVDVLAEGTLPVSGRSCR